MKTAFALSLVCLTTGVTAFAPQAQNGRVSVAREALADNIFNMDLFKDKKDQNEYGARGKKNLKLGSITEKSYIPSGLTQAQYDQLRKEEKAKKDANYQRNVAKAGVFTDYTEWYKKRGTELSQGWKKSVTLGHEMAKTKYDWSGKRIEDNKVPESANVDSFTKGFFGQKKAAPKKKAVAKAPKKKYNF